MHATGLGRRTRSSTAGVGFKVDLRTDAEFVSSVRAGKELCGCGAWDHGEQPETWCFRCRACVDCCMCGDGFTPVRENDGRH